MNRYTWNKNKYHLQNAMVSWCKAFVGEGSWYGYVDDKYPLKDEHQWGCWWSLGQGEFVFRTKEQLNKFTKAWK